MRFLCLILWQLFDTFSAIFQAVNSHTRELTAWKPEDRPGLYIASDSSGRSLFLVQPRGSWYRWSSGSLILLMKRRNLDAQHFKRDTQTKLRNVFHAYVRLQRPMC